MRLLCLLLSALGCFCQQLPSAIARPKIGVALEGGGALGLAHIGVLQWFEDHHIPIDYLAGTSMGGLVGGMYATGMRAAEIRELVSKIDWQETMEGQPPFKALAYRRKEDKRAFQNGLEFGLRNGFSAASGLSSGQRITYLVNRIAFPYSNLKTFDDLPVPFRCVATDLTSGKQHVFEDGSLGEAMRATMSLPAVFTPVTTEKSVWADGGLLNNLPVDVVKKMGADIVIAVYLDNTPSKPQGNQSLLGVMGRSVGVMIAANEIHSLETADLVISVDLSRYTSTSYSATPQIIGQGLQAPETKAALLGKLALDEAAWQQHLASRDAKRVAAPPAPAFVEVSGVDRSMAAKIEDRLADNAGKQMDFDRLEKDIDVISGIGRYTRFSYATTERNGQSGLRIQAEQKDYAPPLLNIGFLVDGSDLNSVQWTMNARITALDVGGFRSEWRTDISIGSTWGLATEYYHPLTAASKWFIAPRAFATNVPFDLYHRTTQLGQYRIRDYGGGFDGGYAFDRFSELRIGYEGGYLDPKLTIGSPVLPEPAGRTGISSVRYNLDRLDSPVVPRSGEIVSLRTGWVDASPGASRGFPLAEAYFGVFRRVSKRSTAYVQGYGGSTFGHYNTGVPQFFLGGPGQLNAYGKNELRTDQYWLGRVGYLYELFSLPPLIGRKTYFTSAYEVAHAYGAPGASRLPTDGSVGLVVETLFGPLFVGGSYGDSGHHRFYFSLGRLF